MFPGYVTIYKDNESFVHLYFFKGLKDDLSKIYEDIDLSNSKLAYTTTINDDGSIDYKFASKKILGMVCNLIDTNGNENKIKLKL